MSKPPSAATPAQLTIRPSQEGGAGPVADLLRELTSTDGPYDPWLGSPSCDKAVALLRSLLSAPAPSAPDVAALIAEYDDGSFSPSWKWCRLAAAMLRRLSAPAGMTQDKWDLQQYRKLMADHECCEKAMRCEAAEILAQQRVELLRRIVGACRSEHGGRNTVPGVCDICEAVDAIDAALAAQDKDANG